MLYMDALLLTSPQSFGDTVCRIVPIKLPPPIPFLDNMDPPMMARVCAPIWDYIK